MDVDFHPFHIAVFPESGEPYHKSFPSLDKLAAHMRTLTENDRGYAFAGSRIGVTDGPWRYLMYDEKQIPLFEQPSPGKIDKSSSFGHKSATVDSPTDNSYDGLMKTMPQTEAVDAEPSKSSFPPEQELPIV